MFLSQFLTILTIIIPTSLANVLPDLFDDDFFESRQAQQATLSLNLPEPLPSVVMMPRFPIPPIPPRQAQVLNILSQAAAQIGQLVNAPIHIRPAGSGPFVQNGHGQSPKPTNSVHSAVPSSSLPVTQTTGKRRFFMTTS